MKHLIQICGLLALFTAAPALAEEANGGFGEPFAAVPHPGFSDPVSDAEAAATIEPAAGAEDAAATGVTQGETQEINDLLQPSFEGEAAETAIPAAE